MSQSNISLFAQALGLINRDLFKRIVKEYDTDKHHKGINSWTHLVSMLFMQLSGATSVRDISNGLRSATGNLSHLGVGLAPSKSSISYINQHRTYEIFRDMYFALLDQLESSLHRKRQYARQLKRKIFIMDASIIPLSLSLFDWAKFRKKKGAIKLHTVLDYDTGLPCYAVLTDGKTHDLKEAHNVVFPADSVLVVDRAYVDYQWLYNLDSTGVFFVTRLKSNADVDIAESFLTNEKHEHILSDQDVHLTGFYSSKNYPKILRIVKVFDAENGQELILLTCTSPHF